MTNQKPLPKMLLGFVVRRCAVALGHHPSPRELADWANNYREGEDSICLFGRPISVAEAAIILKHRSRAVSARGAAPYEQIVEPDELEGSNVRSFAAAAARLRPRLYGKG
jgi:hypothetical protein